MYSIQSFPNETCCFDYHKGSSRQSSVNNHFLISAYTNSN